MKSISMSAMFVAGILAFGQPRAAEKHGPDCSGRWPTTMTFAALKNARLVNNSSIDFSKTRTSRMASEKVGENLWHQVYLVTFVEKSGKKLEAIAVHNASEDECSMSGVEVFVVSQHLGDEAK